MVAEPFPPPKPKADLLIRNAKTVVTCVPQSSDFMGRIENGFIAISGEQILSVGSAQELSRQVDTHSAQVIDATDKIVVPGFVDSHTHLVFGGSRVQEYAARMTRSLSQVRELGIPVGIAASVDMTRAASLEQLIKSAGKRLENMLNHGTTTIESKSGYGLDLSHELKMLEVNRQLNESSPVDIVSTFLGAHALPSEVTYEAYVEMVIKDMIPEVAERGLAKFCDVYCDKGYFGVKETQRILEAARDHGFLLKIHTDQYSSLGGSSLAAELKVVSADHLNYTPYETMRLLADRGVVGVVMPAIDFAVGHPHPFDARAMLEANMTVALASDLCPACWTESLQLVMQFACRQNRFSAEEALFAATVGGARALVLDDRGSLEPGKLADIQIWDLPSLEDVIYRLGHNAVAMVIKRGKVVIDRTKGVL